MSVSGWWVLVAIVGWTFAIQFYGWYRVEKWYAREMKKLHVDALKHWDETREALREALQIYPSSLTRRRDKEFKS